MIGRENNTLVTPQFSLPRTTSESVHFSSTLGIENKLIIAQLVHSPQYIYMTSNSLSQARIQKKTLFFQCSFDLRYISSIGYPLTSIYIVEQNATAGNFFSLTYFASDSCFNLLI